MFSVSSGEESSSSTSKSMPNGTIISHTHKLINISLRPPTSHDPFPLRLPPSKSSSEELPNRTQKTPCHDQDEDDSNSSTSSANFIADNEDLLIQIFVYLPPNSLIRLQSVSKQWLSIIADPSFRRRHFTLTSASTDCGAHFLYRKGMNNTPDLNFISCREKLVYVWYDHGEIRLATYASETRVWRDCEFSLQDHGYFNFKKGILWNGNFHWASDWWLTTRMGLESGFDALMMPPLLPAVVSPPGEEEEHVWLKIFFFGVCGGDLCLVGLKEPQSLLFDVFKMELDYSRWSVKYCLDLFPLTTLYPSMADEVSDPYFAWGRCKFSVLSCLVDKIKKQPVLMISVPGKVISCDMHRMIVKEIADVVPENAEDHDGRDMPRYDWMEAFQHVETLASV